MFNHPYICISTSKSLSDNELIVWYNAVLEYGPTGVISSTELRPDNKQQRFYRRIINGKDCYTIVLSRDLTLDEANNIAKHIDGKIPDIDFEITWSQKPTIDTKYEKIGEDILKSIALEAAKRNHSIWVNKKINEGWRYGQNFHSRNKISPMCRDWDALSETYKKAEYHRMKSLLNVLDEMNLSLMAKRR